MGSCCQLEESAEPQAMLYPMLVLGEGPYKQEIEMAGSVVPDTGRETTASPDLT